MLPLSNIKVIELAGLAPVPLCGMILADYGARVIRVDNIKAAINDEVLNRGKESICLNLKRPSEVNILRRLISTADVLLDPYRPGVLEKLCLVPAELQRENPGLIVARLSGYGQIRADDSLEVVRLKKSAGHDINYVAMSGVLSRLGSEAECPRAPLNILADFGGGAMSCVCGILAALVSRARNTSQSGHVVDTALTLSCAYVCSFLWRSRDKAPFLWPQTHMRGANVLDGGAPFYRCYRTLDQRFLAVGALEPQFYDALLRLLLVPATEAPQYDVDQWTSIAARFAHIFASRTSQEWMEAVCATGEDCCITPVLSLDEAAQYWSRDFLHSDGRSEPGPHPRLSDTESAEASLSRPKVGQDTEAVLREIGCSEDEIRAMSAGLTPRL